MKQHVHFFALFALLTVLLMSFVIAHANGVTALLWLNPASTKMGQGESADIVVQLDNAANVYGIQMELSFNPAVLQVEDADGGKGGIQITPGGCPAPDFVVVNAADNATGSIRYAATQLNPTPPCTGGQVASIQFTCLVDQQSSVVAFISTVISDPDGIVISHSTQNATIQCGEGINVFLPLVLRP